MNPETDKLFDRHTVLLVPFGIALNILFAQIVIRLGWPLYFDSIGTIYAAALGGLLPGIMVGFFSNAINSIGDPITLYYSVISVLLAMLAALFSRKRLFTRFSTTLLTALPFAIVGGVLGSVLTWALSGLTLGSGVSSPYVDWLITRFGMTSFLAQLTADFSLDLVDKLATVLLVFVAIRCTPARWMEKFPNGDVYLATKGAETNDAGRKEDIHGG